MAKPTGFIDYPRACAPDRPVAERLKDFAWVHNELDDAARKEQAGRCMDCGVPFCQTEVKLSATGVGCPLSNLIPEWNTQLWNGNLPAALTRLTKTNCFPEFTGYVCPAPCETACSCGKYAEAVTINDNERYIIDSAFEQGLMQPKVPARRSGKTVAVVGSGPAGLTAANLLNQRGHFVTVFERNATPGGLLTYGIPSMKLPYNVVARRIDLLKAEGIEFRCKVNVNVDLALDDLAQSYDAVVLAAGAQKPREVEFDGTARGICFALDYMGSVAKQQLGEAPLPEDRNAQGKTVAIVGAGDSANDCIACALRQGAANIIQIIRRPATDYGPASDYAHQEAQEALGRDIRCFKSKVARAIADESGALCALELSTPDGTKTIEAQMLVIASGFQGTEDYVTAAIPENARNIFRAGDMEIGASLVVKAMAHARKTAAAVDTFLNGYTTIS